MHKKSQLRRGITETATVVSEDGEILKEEVKSNEFIANSKEQFFLGYVTMLSVFKDISGPSIKVYAYLLQNYNTGSMIGINMAIKQDIKKFIKSKCEGVGVIDNCLSQLVKSNLLFKQKGVTGAFYINPRYAFKGSTRERNDALKAVIKLGCRNC